MLHVFRPLGLLLLCCLSSLTSSAYESGKDTTRAYVVYNEVEVILDEDAEHTRVFDAYVDSVMALPDVSEEVIKGIELCKSINKRHEEELVSMIDSLFDLDDIPYALVNEINYQLSSRTRHDHDDHDFAYTIPYDDSPYPANYHYKSWNTTRTNPYTHELSRTDTSLVLVLGDSASFCGYHHPVDNIVTSKFGWRDGRNHNGIDLDLEVWDEVHSSWAGKVRFSGWAGGFGRLVIVRHYNGLETYYAHLHRLKVAVGDEVEAGSVIGLGGSSGHSTGSHLHYEIRFKGIPLNPEHLISFSEQRMLSDTIILEKSRWSYAVYPKGVKYHYVKSGDFLQRIAQRYGTTINHLCDINGIRRNDYLRVGQKLRVALE